MTESSTPRADAVENELAARVHESWPAAISAFCMSITRMRELERAFSEDNAFHDALQELAVAQGKDPEQWDPIGVVDDALAQQDYAAAIAQALDLVLPMARGYAAEHPVGNNATMIEQAEAALDSTPRGAVAASAAEAYAVALQSLLERVLDAFDDLDLYDHCKVIIAEGREFLAKNPEWPKAITQGLDDRPEETRHEIGTTDPRTAGAGLDPDNASHSIRKSEGAGDVSASTNTWRHKKRGTLYTEVACAWLQTETPIGDGATMTIYRDDDGRWWVRPRSEFMDGRFEAVPAAATCSENAVGIDFEQAERIVQTLNRLARPYQIYSKLVIYNDQWREIAAYIDALREKVESSQDTGFAQGWRAAIAAAATWVDRKGWEGTANALADDLCEPSQEGHATCNPQEADRG